MKVRIEIDTRTFVRFWLVVIGFAFALLAIYSALSALIVIGAAFFLAIALNGPVNRLAELLPGKSRIGGTAIAFVIVVAILGVVIFLVIPPIIQQSARFVETVPALVDSATQQWHGLNTLIMRYHLEQEVAEAVNAVKSSSAAWAASIGSNFVSGIGSLVGLITSTLLALVLAFLMLVEGPTWLQRLWTIYEYKERMENHRRLIGRMHRVVTGYVTGQLTVSAVGSAFAGLTVFILHFIFPAIPVNLALPTVAIAFLLSLIPLFGATISGILITILLAMNDVTAAVVFIIYFVIYQQIENNFISPTIQSKAVEMSALAVLIAVTIGLYVFGIAGGIISIPIAGCVKVLFEEYLARKNAHAHKSEKPFHKLVKKLQNNEA
jgi:predicted PurR-regulated permease PerM